MLKPKGAACLDIHRQEGAAVREQARESLHGTLERAP